MDIPAYYAAVTCAVSVPTLLTLSGRRVGVAVAHTAEEAEERAG